MGRININFHVSHALAAIAPSCKPDVIPAQDLAMVLLNLPGATYLTGSSIGIQNYNKAYTENTIEAINDVLPDGTDVTCNYKREGLMVNGCLQQFDRYDGFSIDTHKVASTQSSNQFFAGPTSSSNSTSTPVPGPNAYPAQFHNNCQHEWFLYVGLHDTYECCKICGIKK